MACLSNDLVHPYDRFEITLITVGPGAVYWERFGHNAVLVNDRRGRQLLYHYGLFDFEDENFLFNFIRGHMTYRMVANDQPEREFAYYRGQDRSIWAQALTLDGPQKERLITHLEWNRRPANARYRYDYFFANCSTKIRDALDLALQGGLRAAFANQPAQHPLRWHVNRLTAAQPWLYLGTEIGLGPLVDRPIERWDEFFLPMELMRAIANAGLAAEPQASYTTHTLAEPTTAPALTMWFLSIGLGLAIALTLIGQRWRWPLVLWFIGLGLGGGVLTMLWIFTDHIAAHRNLNLLLMSPFALVAAGIAARRKPHRPIATRFVVTTLLVPALIASVLSLLPNGQRNLPIVMLLLPPLIGACLAMRLRQR